MAHWAVAVPVERYEAERLFLHETLELTGLDGPLPAVGDEVALVAVGAEPVVFALGRVVAVGGDAHDPDDPAAGQPATALDIEYTYRLFDAPLPADDLVDGADAGHGAGVLPVAPDRFAALVDKVAAEPAARREWLVGVYLPIEASSPAEAVRAFWTHVQQLGPRELPAYVSPRGDELAMQAYVLGEVTNLDPEEDDED
ncbi:hypothetical protein HC028_03690 [Planosporangium flavigriseum]|uniref:Uncharacterized protein n=1 Tax=Planosporangium flavigriseum TaxID=373681 RepID=A0A8J3PJZ3_9ACTN|nr:hypothetical protein [Planosporangium flavigriseum]NJC63615.1 hypothetical protein [Planosporangium flavigriseum]GIG72317.1 hypothetical protein Pfl04_07210 [Planosporangium flavigriseum]